MAKVEIEAGICGFSTVVKAHMEGEDCVLNIESGCKGVQNLVEELKRVDPFREISHRGEGPQTLQMAAKHCKHPACPVPAGIIKAVEVAAGLALPQDVVIRVTASDE